MQELPQLQPLPQQQQQGAAFPQHGNMTAWRHVGEQIPLPTYPGGNNQALVGDQTQQGPGLRRNDQLFH